jgi:hypothetical protein
MTRAIVALLVANLILSVIALGWLAWLSADPQYWFPDAYAQQGPRGEQGPRGAVGPEGPAGPVGPDAVDAIDVLSSRLDDLESESGASDLQFTVDDLGSRVDDLESAVNETLCPWISEASDYVYSC